MRQIEIIALAVSIAIGSAAAAQGVRKPVPLPGIDPGGVMVAFVGPGIDYTRDGLAERLARDGEGEIIGFDLVDRDRRPFCRVECEGHTEAALALVKAAPDTRLAVFKIDEARQLAAPALQMAVSAKAAVVLVADLPDDPQTAALLRAASERFRDTLIVYAPRAAPAAKDTTGQGTAGQGTSVDGAAANRSTPEVTAPQGTTPKVGTAQDTTSQDKTARDKTAQDTVAQDKTVQATGPQAISPGSTAQQAAPLPATTLPATGPAATAEGLPAADGASGTVTTAPAPVAPNRNDNVITVRDVSVNSADTPIAAAARLAAEAARIVADSPSTRGAALKARLEKRSESGK